MTPGRLLDPPAYDAHYARYADHGFACSAVAEARERGTLRTFRVKDPANCALCGRRLSPGSLVTSPERGYLLATCCYLVVGS